MLELLKAKRLISIKKQYDKLKSDALQAMEAGDLEVYYDKLARANKLKMELSETVAIEVEETTAK